MVLTLGSINHVANGNHIDGSGQKLVQALYDYDPLIQSPNDSPSDELSFHRGDYITVFGEPDESGFYEVKLIIYGRYNFNCLFLCLGRAERSKRFDTKRICHSSF